MTMVLGTQAPTVIRSFKISKTILFLVSFIIANTCTCTAINRSVIVNSPEDLDRYRHHRKLLLSDSSNAVQGQWIIVVNENGMENVILELEKVFNNTQRSNTIHTFVAEAANSILISNVDSFESIASLLDYDDVNWIEQVRDDFEVPSFLDEGRLMLNTSSLIFHRIPFFTYMMITIQIGCFLDMNHNILLLGGWIV